MQHSHPPRRHRHVLLALSWYYPEIHHAVAQYARDHDWHVTADFDDPVPQHWSGDGVLTHLGAGHAIWRSLRRLRVPMVDLTETRPNIKLPRVTMDNVAIGKLAARHFLDRGFRHFAYVHRWDLGVARRRRRAFLDELRAAGFTCEVLGWEKERGRKVDNRLQRHRWLVRRLKRLPTPLAVFAMRDLEAVEVVEACQAAGLAVPEQVAVLGADNNVTLSDCLSVPLSSIDTNLARVGYEGAALLDQLMSGGRPPDGPVYIPPVGVVQRRSTDMLAVEHAGVAAALEFIQAHHHRNLSVPEIAGAVAMSRSGLEKAFRDYYVRPPAEELRRVRLEHAKALLRDTEEKIASVAQATGFQTSQNLCRVFRRSIGSTPKEYRVTCADSRDTR